MITLNKNLISKNDTVAVAVSGGADSIALLYCLHTDSLKSKNYSVVAINVEHGIRGEDSKKDSLFVQDFCKKHSIPLYSYTVDSVKESQKLGVSIEQAARILRYKCFQDCLDKKLCDKIATAHHANDNAETVLFNLFRGTSLKGVAGIKEQNGAYIRPLLYTTKEDILNYVVENKLEYVTDLTNYDTDITRNHIRINVLGEIEKKFPYAVKNISNLSKLIEEEDSYLDELCQKYLKKEGEIYKIDVKTPPVLLKRAVLFAIKDLGVVADYTSVHAESVLSLVNLENGSKICLPQNVAAYREYDYISILKEDNSDKISYPFSVGTFDFGKTLLTVESVELNEQTLNEVKKESGNYKKAVLYADSDKIPENAVIRTRENGDVFTKFGGSSKKLKDYFIDCKVPQRLRSDIPLIAINNKILFAGFEISPAIKVDSQTKNVIKLSYQIKEKE